MDIDVDELDVDLLSFSSHKFYGPKGVGGLYVRERGRRVKLSPQIVGGSQQENRRSGQSTASVSSEWRRRSKDAEKRRPQSVRGSSNRGIGFGRSFLSEYPVLS